MGTTDLDPTEGHDQPTDPLPTWAPPAGRTAAPPLAAGPTEPPGWPAFEPPVHQPPADEPQPSPGTSPRKAALTLYLVDDHGVRQAEADALFGRLGKHSTGKSCLYIKQLDKVDRGALEALVALSWQLMNERYG